jgi:hypothetical protein
MTWSLLSLTWRPAISTAEFSIASGGGQPCVNDKLSIYRFQRSSWEKEGTMLTSVHIP